MPLRWLVVVGCLVGLLSCTFVGADEAADARDGWQLSLAAPGQLDVSWGSERVTGYRFTELKKPALYPAFGPGGHSMVRNYPLLKGVAGEATDHPHHKSIWLAHGDVNGYSYWDERAVIANVTPPQIEADAAAFVVVNQWLAPGQGGESKSGESGSESTEQGSAGGEQVVIRERTRVSFGRLSPEQSPLAGGWWVQYQVQLTAASGEVRFGDTKEGFFAMRTHPNLRLTNDPRAGVTTANGRALNSQGQRDRELWGQSAAWVAYGGMIDQQPVTVVMMDHPKNLRHPTTWHAREYGLVAANPFGLHDFQKKPSGAGDHVVPQGQSLECCYRIAFLPSLLDEAAIAAAYSEFAASPHGWGQ
jgi:hypothetical protein